jgi:hypothetical protein
VSLTVLETTESHRDKDGKRTRLEDIATTDRQQPMLQRVRQPHDNGTWACPVCGHLSCALETRYVYLYNIDIVCP